MHTTLSSPQILPPKILLPFQTLLSCYFPLLLHRWMAQAGSPGWAILDYDVADSSGTTAMRGHCEEAALEAGPGSPYTPSIFKEPLRGAGGWENGLLVVTEVGEERTTVTGRATPLIRGGGRPKSPRSGTSAIQPLLRCGQRGVGHRAQLH